VIWEQSTASVEEMGIRRVIIRTGVFLAKEGGALRRLLLPYRFFVGGPMGSGRQWYSWIHPDDLTSAIRFLIENDKAVGIFNLTAPHPLPNREFGKALGRVLKRPSLVPLPGFVLQVMFGEVSSVVLDGQRVLPKRLLDLGFEFKFSEVETAFRDLLER
jgi:uncharacterized protein (TIGR01777 family)